MLNSINELRLKSGKRIFYAFESPLQEVDGDWLAELDTFQIRGPLSDKISELSPRYKEYLNSRYLLLQLLKDLKRRQIGGCAISLSHTKDAVLCASVPTLAFEGAALCSGVGADLENLQRKISELAHKRIVNGARDSQVEALLLWGLKEAAYKAHPDNQSLLITDFVVTEIMDDYNFELYCSRTGKTFESLCLYVSSYQIVLAVIK